MRQALYLPFYLKNRPTMILTKDDILDFFNNEYSKEECDQTCPFVEECNSILAKTSGRDTLCDVLGVSNGVSSEVEVDEESEDEDDYF
jgi:hypothetical protein